MKAKKLTKREWYLAAQFWYWERAEDPEFFGTNWDVIEAALDVIENRISEYIPASVEDRWFLYSQYCLERAGIPTGKP